MRTGPEAATRKYQVERPLRSIGLVSRTLDSDRLPETEGGHETPGRLAPPLPPNSPRFRWTRIILGGVELTHMIAKWEMKSDGGRHSSVAWQFYDLAK